MGNIKIIRGVFDTNLHTIMKNGLKRHYVVYHIDYQCFNL